MPPSLAMRSRDMHGAPVFERAGVSLPICLSFFKLIITSGMNTEHARIASWIVQNDLIWCFGRDRKMDAE